MARLSNRIKAQLDNSGAIMPIGTIVAYAPGYFGAVSNGGGWTIEGPATNDVAGINAYLPSNWRVCNGSAPNDPDSPIFNTAGRFLPELTGSRFLMGNTAAGTAGGNTGNQVTLSSTELPNHNHPVGTLATGNDNAPHNHPLTISSDNANHTHPDSFATGPHNAPHSHANIRISNTAGVYDDMQTFNIGDDNLNTNAVHGIEVFDNRGNSPSGTRQSTTSTDNAPHNHPVTGAVNPANAPHNHPGSSVNTQNAPHNHPVTGSVGPSGTGSAFSILPLYVTAFYIMRIK